MPSTFVLYFSETKFSFMKTNQKIYLKKKHTKTRKHNISIQNTAKCVLEVQIMAF